MGSRRGRARGADDRRHLDSVRAGEAALVAKIADVIIERRLPVLVDVRDESTDDVRIVLEIKRDTDPALAWDWFGRAAPSYQKTAIHWVVSAKQPQTQARRLAALIADSAAGHAVQPLTRPTNTREDA